MPATVHSYPDASFISSADYTGNQYFAVKLHTVQNQIVLAGASGKGIGFLQNAPNTGEEAIVRCGGFSLAAIGEASLTVTDLLTSITEGDLEQGDAAGEFIMAMLVDDSGTVADGDVREVFILHLSPHASDA